jgi:hypothetical protein
VLDAVAVRRADGSPPTIAVVDATEEGLHGSTLTADLAVAAADWQLHVLVVTGPESGARLLLESWSPDDQPRPQEQHRPGEVDLVVDLEQWTGQERPWDVVLADTPALLGDGASASTASRADAVIAAVPRGSDVKRLLLLRRRVDELQLHLVGFVELAPRQLRDRLPSLRRLRAGRLRPAQSVVAVS